MFNHCRISFSNRNCCWPFCAYSFPASHHRFGSLCAIIAFTRTLNSQRTSEWHALQCKTPIATAQLALNIVTCGIYISKLWRGLEYGASKANARTWGSTGGLWSKLWGTAPVYRLECNATARRSSTMCTTSSGQGKSELSLGTQFDGERIDSVSHRSI